MSIILVWKRVCLFLAFLAGFSASELHAQFGGCSCFGPNPKPFGSCLYREVFEGNLGQPPSDAYPDNFPGPAAFVPGVELGDESPIDVILVADLFSGKAYRYRYVPNFPISNIARIGDVVSSPNAGAANVTGLTYDASEGLLYWATGNEIWTTDSLGENGAMQGTVNMEALAEFVRGTGATDIVTGSLGGIAFHEGTRTLWGVDIVNDLYFEMSTTGDIGSSPRFFFSPLRGPGGAFGNDLAYVANEDGEFLDIPVGSLSDGRPSRVMRVYASDGDGFSVGDQYGAMYLLDDEVSSPEFVTGIVHWPNSCQAGNDSQILLDYRPGSPRIIEVPGSPPSEGTLVDLSCTQIDESTAQLAWSQGLAYVGLTIRRRPMDGEEFTDVATLGPDDLEYVDMQVAPGSYEYEFEVDGDGATQTCRLNLGRGAARGNQALSITTPFAVATTNDRVVVADLVSGQAELLDLNLNPVSTLDSPFDDAGLVVGIGFNSDNDSLYWLQRGDRSHWLLQTDLSGTPQGDLVFVDTPHAFTSEYQLGDLSYDGRNGVFWTIDRVTRSIFPISPDGTIPEPFFSAATLPTLPAEMATSGGFAVAGSGAEFSSVTVDLPVGVPGRLDDYVRVTIDTTNEQVTEDFRFGLVPPVESAAPGSVALSAAGSTYVSTIDTARIYQLDLTQEELPSFQRGDANNDGDLNISDPSSILNFLFGLSPVAPPCDAAADASGDDLIDISDAIALFEYLFNGGAQPPPPFGCGVDPTTTLSCNASTCQGT